MGNCSTQQLIDFCPSPTPAPTIDVDLFLQQNGFSPPTSAPTSGSTYCDAGDLPFFRWIDGRFIATGIVGTFCLLIMAIYGQFRSHSPKYEPFQRLILIINSYMMVAVTFSFMLTDFIQIILEAKQRKDNIFEIWLCELPLGNDILLMIIVQLFCVHLSINVTRLIYELTRDVPKARKYFWSLLIFHSAFYFFFINILPFPFFMILLVIMDYSLVYFLCLCSDGETRMTLLYQICVNYTDLIYSVSL